MRGKRIEIRKSEFAKKGHEVILEKLLKLCNRQGLQEGGITRILDAGSGRTSLKEIQKAFPAAQVDAVVYPGGERKLKSIEIGRASCRERVSFAV